MPFLENPVTLPQRIVKVYGNQALTPSFACENDDGMVACF